MEYRLCLSLGLDHLDDRRTQLQRSSHATGLFPAASVVWHVKIHGRESGNDLSTLGIMEPISLNLMQNVSLFSLALFKCLITVLFCSLVQQSQDPQLAIAVRLPGDENPALAVRRAPAMARIDRRLHELGRKIGSPSTQVKPLR